MADTVVMMTDVSSGQLSNASQRMREKRSIHRFQTQTVEPLTNQGHFILISMIVDRMVAWTNEQTDTVSLIYERWCLSKIQTSDQLSKYATLVMNDFSILSLFRGNKQQAT